MKRIGKILIGVSLIIFILVIMTVNKIYIGSFSGRMGIIGSIILVGLIMFGWSLIKPSTSNERVNDTSSDDTKSSSKKEEDNAETSALKKLLNDGIITKEEYEAKKKQQKRKEIEENNDETSALKELLNNDIITKEEYEAKKEQNERIEFQKKKEQFNLEKKHFINEFNENIRLKKEEQLKSLNLLKENGTFTDKEYEEKKTKLERKCIILCLQEFGIRVLLNDDVRIIKTGDRIQKKEGNMSKNNKGTVVWIDTKNLDYFIVRSEYETRKWNTSDCIFAGTERFFNNDFSYEHFDYSIKAES